MQQTKAVIVITFIVTLYNSSSGYKILLYPLNIRSHLIVAGRFGEALAQNGHQAHLLVASNNKPAQDLDPKVKVMTYDVTMEEPFGVSDRAAKMEIRAIQLAHTSFMEWIIEGVQIYVNGIYELNRDCEDLLSNAQLISQLAKENYDLVVLDSVHIAYCPPMLAYKLNVPVAILSTTNNEWFYRIPHLSNLPSIATESTDVMTFSDRVKSFVTDLTEHFALNGTTYYSEKYVPEKPPKSALDIDREALFVFGLYDPVLVYPRPLMPNTIDIADIMVRPGKPLDQEFTSIMESTRSGVILMSLGSSFSQMPGGAVRRFCEAFSGVSPTFDVIWHSGKHPNCTTSSNVIVKSWVPQNDLLAHRNLKLFITHGGLNSYIEAVNHGKPMIAFPLSLDRPRYALAMETKGLGIRMNILDFTTQELVDNINSVLHNESYTKAAQLLSTKMNNKILPVDKRIAFWVEHIIQFGGDHLRTGVHKLSLFEFLMLDVYAVLFVLIIFVCVLFFCTSYAFIRLCITISRRFFSKLKKD